MRKNLHNQQNLQEKEKILNSLFTLQPKQGLQNKFTALVF